MIIDDFLLSYNEKLVMKLRELYFQTGYRNYQMSKFEEYDLYAENKDFFIRQNHHLHRQQREADGP